MENYPYKAKQFLEEASQSFTRMKETQNVDELKRAFISFLNASRFCTQQLLTDFKSRLIGFSEWWETSSSKYLNNPICIFFVYLRNEVTKAGNDVLQVGFEIGNLTLKGGGFTIGPNGIMKRNDKGNTFEMKPYNTSELRIISWNFKNLPDDLKQHSGEDLCKIYLGTLDGLLDEFIKEFCKT